MEFVHSPYIFKLCAYVTIILWKYDETRTLTQVGTLVFVLIFTTCKNKKNTAYVYPCIFYTDKTLRHFCCYKFYLHKTIDLPVNTGFIKECSHLLC